MLLIERGIMQLIDVSGWMDDWRRGIAFLTFSSIGFSGSGVSGFIILENWGLMITLARFYSQPSHS